LIRIFLCTPPIRLPAISTTMRLNNNNSSPRDEHAVIDSPSLRVMRTADMVRCNTCAHDNPPGVRQCENCGADLPRTVRSVALTASLEQEVRGLLDRERKIEAIKRVREVTGAGLKEARDAVEAVEQGLTPVDAFVLEEPSLRELVELVRNGNKILAIKLYRDSTGAGLREAKDAVEALERNDPTQ
jgi:ribosomal protein L7/L12